MEKLLKGRGDSVGKEEAVSLVVFLAGLWQI